MKSPGSFTARSPNNGSSEERSGQMHASMTPPMEKSVLLALRADRHCLVRDFFLIYIYLFIFGCTRSLLPAWVSSSSGEHGPLPSCGAQASHRSDFSYCRARSLGLSSHGAWA